jgi:DNA-binding MarR family transcriptional regulator
MSHPTPEAASSRSPGREDAGWLSAEERAAWLGLLAVIEMLPPVLDAQLRRDVALTHFDYQVLATLADASGDGLSMTCLASGTNATLTRLSHAVRRLEERGLLRREASCPDGRVVVARLTPAGRDAVLRATPGHVDTVRRHVLDALTPSQVRQLRHIGDALRTPLRARQRRGPGARRAQR